jgi:hypothetical protein
LLSHDEEYLRKTTQQRERYRYVECQDKEVCPAKYNQEVA